MFEAVSAVGELKFLHLPSAFKVSSKGLAVALKPSEDKRNRMT